MNISSQLRAVLAEGLGTFMLIACGCGAILSSRLGPGDGLFAISTVWGLTVMTLIYALGPLSGAHFNPAVTLAFAAAGRFEWRQLPAYVAAQTTGGLLAALLLRAIFAAQAGDLGATAAAFPAGGALAMEFTLTAILMFIIMAVSQGSKEQGLMAGVAIGATIYFAIMVGGPVSGASMNPVRSLAPAIVSGDPAARAALWLYFAGPLPGAIAGALLFAGLFSAPAAESDTE